MSVQDLLIPISDVSRGDSQDAQTFADVMPRRLPAGDNYADDRHVIAQLEEDVLPLLDITRRDRSALTDEWNAIRRMEMLIHDEGQKYIGRSQAYLPVYARLLQTQTSTLAKGIFPSDEYMDCVDRRTQDAGIAKHCKTYVQWELERNGKIRRQMKPFIRQLKNFGNSALKFMYRKERRYEGRKLDFQGVMPLQESRFVPISYEGLQLSTRSIFNFYIYPMTADTIEEATLVFEDMEVPGSYIAGQAKLKRWKNVEEALASRPSIPEVDYNRSELHGDAYGVNSANEAGGNLGKLYTLTEAYTFLKLPRSAYTIGENPDCAVPVMILFAGRIPLVVIRNPYFHQRPPYLFTKQNATPGMIYGYGVGRLSRALQYLTNDFANQTNDTGAYTLNPIGIRNPALVAGPQGSIRPGRVWDFTDIEKGFRFERPPVELIGAGMNMAQLFMGWTQELGGAPPQLSGIASGGSKTATGMQILQRNALSPLQDEVEDIEQDIMVPLMYGTWYNGQQFRDREVLAHLAGSGTPIVIAPELLAIDAEFRWLASSQAINSQQRNQQLLAFIQATLPLIPVLAQQGQTIDFAPLLKRVLGDGMGLKGIGDIVRPLMATGGMPPGPGQMPGVMAETGDRLRSALEQAGGVPGEMAPGEGEAFADVRNEADEYAAAMGRTYGGG